MFKRIFGFLNHKPTKIKQTSELEFRRAMEKKIPATAINYTMNLWQNHHFNFSISRARKSVLGNYKYLNQHHYITVNGDSNAYSFLITLIHEIAHQHVTIHYTQKHKQVSPHGQEWKNIFSELMQPLLIEEVFPNDILVILKKHMRNPAASSMKDASLAQILMKYSPEKEMSGVKLEDINTGQFFVFNNKTYKKIESRRTRALVELKNSKKRYTIPEHALVQVVD